MVPRVCRLMDLSLMASSGESTSTASILELCQRSLAWQLSKVGSRLDRSFVYLNLVNISMLSLDNFYSGFFKLGGFACVLELCQHGLCLASL